MRKILISLVAIVFGMQSFIFANYELTQSDQALLDAFEQRIEQVIDERGDEFRQTLFDAISGLALLPSNSSRVTAIMKDLSSRVAMNGQINNMINIDGDNNQVAVTNNQNSNNTTTIINNNTTIINNNEQNINSNNNTQNDNDTPGGSTNNNDAINDNSEEEREDSDLFIEINNTEDQIVVAGMTDVELLNMTLYASGGDGVEVSGIDLDTINTQNTLHRSNITLKLYVDGQAVQYKNIGSNDLVRFDFVNESITEGSPINVQIKGDFNSSFNAGNLQLSINSLSAYNTNNEAVDIFTYNGSVGPIFTIESPIETPPIVISKANNLGSSSVAKFNITNATDTTIEITQIAFSTELYNITSQNTNLRLLYDGSNTVRGSTQNLNGNIDVNNLQIQGGSTKTLYIESIPPFMSSNQNNGYVEFTINDIRFSTNGNQQNLSSFSTNNLPLTRQNEYYGN